MPPEHGRPVHPVPQNAMQARDRVRSLIETSGIVPDGSTAADHVLTDALLVTSELVTNAIRHGGGLVGFSASVSADGLRLAITDASSDRPVTLPRPAGAVRAGGFGWPLVRRLTRSVTIRPTPQGGKRIEVVMPLDAAATPDGPPDRP
ncbi:ATP-binding protein [Streptomyces sp. NPDC006512]|uniref:ATP-binding protein n=1 Tax=Streptomyces sp. NPDC006512 TaxID=3154307 RepID=UPI0033BA2682